ncbi:MAG: aldo/keto reductase [Acidimicrobiia bacterium]|nr:aldo/keto reductase [Acidimicrobiia bacterium]
MRYARIGSLEVSVIGLGCNNFGRALDLEGTKAVVDAALEAGVTFLDTSDNYGEGRSEAYLAAALGDRRDDVVIASKFGQSFPQVEGSGGARPEYIRRAIERSLRQLDTDRIDLYQLHWPDPETPIADTIGTMAELVDEGKVVEIGCCNLDAGQLAEAIAESESAGHPLFVSDQVEYSMLHREPERNGLADVCAANGVSLLPYYPLACGMLTGKVRRGSAPTGRLSMERYAHYLSDANFDVVERLGAFSAGRDLTMAQVAIGWLLAQPAVPAVTPGATSAAQVVENASAAHWVPTTDDLDVLEVALGPVA